MKRTGLFLFIVLWMAIGESILSAFPCEASPILDRDEYAWRRLNGPWGGDTHGLAIDPTNPNHLIAGTYNGVFHSFNGALSWVPASPIPGERPFSHIRFDPFDSSVILGTGSEPFDDACGIYRSDDSGQTWMYLNLRESLNDVWIHRSVPGRYLLGGESGLFMSSDGGASWYSVVSDHQFFEFVDHPDDPDRIYAAVDSAGLGISADGGLTWEFREMPGSVPADDRRPSTGSISIMTEEPFTLFVTEKWNETGRIVRTSDEGLTWETVLSEPVTRVRVAPSHPNVVWAAGGLNHWDAYLPTYIFLSSDFGQTWDNVSTSRGGMAFDLQINPQNPGMAIIARMSDGVIMTEDAGNSWELANRYISATEVFDLALHPSDENTLMVTFRGQGIYRSDRNGLDWEWLGNFPERYLIQVAFKPDEPAVVVAGSTNVYRSEDGGDTWNPTNTYGNAQISEIRFSRADPRYAFCSRYAMSGSWGLWISENGGELWQKRTSVMTYDLGLDWFNPGTLFAQCRAGTTFIFTKTTDFGMTWDPVDVMNQVNDVEGDPIQVDRFYAASASYFICRTDDAGDSWITGLGSDIQGQIMDLAISETTGELCAIAREFWHSTDLGETWERKNEGLFDTTGIHVEIRQESGEDQYYLGTFRSGLWKWMPIDSEPPTVALISPNGGETYHDGETVMITWVAQDNEQLFYCDLFLSLDSGSTWPVVINGAIRQNGSASWVIPQIPSTTCRVKIVAYDPSWNMIVDTSDGDFTINASTPEPTPTFTVRPTFSPTPTGTTPVQTATPTPSPFTQTPTPIETPTPSPFNTETPSATWTPTPKSLQIMLEMPSKLFSAGDTCFLSAGIYNPGPVLPFVPVFIILDAYGQFWCAPSWSNVEQFVDHYTYSLIVGETKIEVIPEFTWPDHMGEGTDLTFWGLLTDPSMTTAISNLAEWSFEFN